MGSCQLVRKFELDVVVNYEGLSMTRTSEEDSGECFWVFPFKGDAGAVLEISSGKRLRLGGSGGSLDLMYKEIFWLEWLEGDNCF